MVIDQLKSMDVDDAMNIINKAYEIDRLMIEKSNKNALQKRYKLEELNKLKAQIIESIDFDRAYTKLY